MLTDLIRLLEQNQGELSLVELGRQLEAEPSAVAGMLETLIRKGRVAELDSDCGFCETCSIQNHCVFAGNRAKRFGAVR